MYRGKYSKRMISYSSNRSVADPGGGGGGPGGPWTPHCQKYLTSMF